MKLHKTLVIGALALASASQASAALNIYIPGSNGDRTPTQKAIELLLAANGNWKFQGDQGSANLTGTTTNSEANALNSNYGAWNGTYNGTNVVIRVSFLGAAGAVYDLAANQPERFVVSDGTGTGAIISPNATNAVLGTDYTTNNANFGFSTVFQATTPYNGVGYNTLIATNVGVSPIVFVASPGFPTNVSITSQLAQNLFASGSLRLSQFTGKSSDSNTVIYPLGRNSDSGQRYGVQAETGIGTANTVQQWKPTVINQTNTNSAGKLYGGTASSQILWPQETVGGIDSGSDGNSGYDTGANLLLGLSVTNIAPTSGSYYDANSLVIPGATNAYYVGYVTTGDYANYTTNVVQLNYNGVTYSSNALIEGNYTSWVYNRIIQRSDATSAGGGLTNATVAQFKNALANKILTSTATQKGGLLISSLNVTRTADGGLVIHK